MVQFTKLRLTGFKSFVDTTDLIINEGLTGIIGPNGCGKSNLVEAIRWAMGESSAKRMRGSAMDDVIFNGTTRRPARNNAEVSLWLDNSDRKAPAELNHSDELEITRKIERDSGSTYRVNGKTVRARDVQLLFADSSIGADSPAMVSQGRVADLINAKPTKRRLILEEAAGISGLHARRHEAELKLRAADTNLTRLEDVLGGMENQLQGLKKQARQANRYRNLSQHIQHADAIILHLKYTTCLADADAARGRFDAAESVVREHTIVVNHQSEKQIEIAGKLPKLRLYEAEASAALQRLKLAYGALESEEQKVSAEQDQAKQMLQQSENDISHAHDLKEEAQDTIENLKSELEKLSTDTINYDDIRTELTQSYKTIAENLEQQENNLNELTQNTAKYEAQKNALTCQINDYSNRLLQIENRLNDLKNEKETILSSASEKQKIIQLDTDINEKQQSYNETKTTLESLEHSKSSKDTITLEKAEAYQSHNKEYQTLNAELSALQNILEHANDGGFTPIIDELTVMRGYEQALAIALGDDLEASLNSEAPIFWQEIESTNNNAEFPNNIKPLSDFVQSPPALNLALSHIGVVADTDIGNIDNLVKQLSSGQSLVTIEGAIWRWDGLTIKAEAKSSAAIRLEQKNRLAELEKNIVQIEEKRSTAKIDLDNAQTKQTDVTDKIKETRQISARYENELNQLQNTHRQLTHSMAQINTKIATLDVSIENLNQEKIDIQAKQTQAQSDIKDIPETGDTQEIIQKSRDQLSDMRNEISDIKSRINASNQEEQQKNNRIQVINTDRKSWQSRFKRSDERLSDLKSRIKTTQDTLYRLKEKPHELESKKLEILDKSTIAKEARDLASDTLVIAERKHYDIQQELKMTEKLLSDHREKRALSQGDVSTTRNSLSSINEQVTEKFNCPAEDLFKTLNIDIDEEDIPHITELQEKLEKLSRERENMGPVNLRADVEAQELSDEITHMETERDDLIGAIRKLRQGISRLNKEARERLVKAFDEVNHHFSTLFEHLFEGGNAYLELIGSDDPLEAGLEIFAQPPGKKLQNLTLLSGGEQTLTSIALIFGMFQTNPAPICVLDEIDAPLDDSNVNRVCNLLDKLTKTSSTRFIIISHHRMTMARMDRLYGVTMSEKGISQLVSVDLTQPDLLDNLAA